MEHGISVSVAHFEHYYKSNVNCIDANVNHYHI